MWVSARAWALLSRGFGQQPRHTVSIGTEPLTGVEELTTLKVVTTRRRGWRREAQVAPEGLAPRACRWWVRTGRRSTHCSYRRLRADGLRRFPANQTIRSIKLYHRQIYGYAFHRPKLEFMRSGSIDDKRIGDRRFAALADFLESIPTTCPHDLFRRDDDPKARASKASPTWADASRIIPAVGNNKLRHGMLQRFMLANDSVTVAIEIPIWLAETDIAALEEAHQVELVSRRGAAERAITGHIDFLQVRNGAVHILDYKPDARTNKPIAQLAIYALALTRLVPGLKLFDIKCAWFNEREYCEFFPRTLFV